jgi:hypothetical protein
MREAIGVTFALALLAWAAPAGAQEWGGEGDSVRAATLGEQWGNPIKYDLRTQFASLHSSYVRLELTWYDPYAKAEVSQVLFDDERASRLDQYEFKYDQKKLTLEVTYACPTEVKDNETRCVETWVWRKGSREFDLASTRSTNPVSEDRDEMFEMIREGKFDEVRASIAALQKKYGDDKVPWIPLYNAFVERLHRKIVKDMEERDYELAAARIEAFFVKKPPMAFPLRCPDHEKVLICVTDLAECGCTDPHVQLEATEEVAEMFADITRALYKNQDYALAVRLGERVSGKVPNHSGLRLVLADAYWELDKEEEAGAHYAAVRKIRWAEKTFIPKRVFDRFTREAKKSEDAPAE